MTLSVDVFVEQAREALRSGDGRTERRLLEEALAETESREVTESVAGFRQYTDTKRWADASG